MKSTVIRLILVTAIVACSVRSEAGQATNFWLPILATRSNLSDALATVKRYQIHKAELSLLKTDDCHNLRKDLVIIVAGIHDSRASAKSAVNEWRQRGIKDAYRRRCEVVVPSRLSLGVPLLDASFMQRPLEVVNWDLNDAVSRVISLNQDFAGVIVPRYEKDPNDIREGLRISVRLYNLNANQAIDLSTNCIDPEFALGAARLALSCVSERAANYLLHHTLLYALPDGKIVAEADRCTEPKFENNRWICRKESVEAEGNLRLEPKKLDSN